MIIYHRRKFLVVVIVVLECGKFSEHCGNSQFPQCER